MIKQVLLSLVLFAASTQAREQQCDPAIPATSPIERFQIAKDLVIDTQTGLMWRRCFEGASGLGCSTGAPANFTWAKALQYIGEVNQTGRYLNYNDWRMPNIKELASIVEMQCQYPALNLALFPAAPSARTWSSTPYKLYTHYSWFVDFSEFTTNHLGRYQEFHVLLVRNAQ